MSSVLEGSKVLAWVATAMMVVGVVFDLRTRKYPNKIFIASTLIGLIACVVFSGWQGLLVGILGFLAGILILLPLTLLKMVGAGDMKLLAAFGLVTGPEAVLMTVIWGLAWASMLGLVQILVAKQGRLLANNLIAIVLFRQRAGLPLHTIPLTVGLFLGWMTHWLLGPEVRLLW